MCLDCVLEDTNSCREFLAEFPLESDRVALPWTEETELECCKSEVGPVGFPFVAVFPAFCRLIFVVIDNALILELRACSNIELRLV